MFEYPSIKNRISPSNYKINGYFIKTNNLKHEICENIFICFLITGFIHYILWRLYVLRNPFDKNTKIIFTSFEIKII